MGELNIHHHSFALFKRGWHIDYALVAAATETQPFIFKGFDKTSVYEHINMLKQSLLYRVFEKFLEKETRIAPDILVALLLDSLGKGCKALWLEHGVTTRKGYIGKRVGKNLS